MHLVLIPTRIVARTHVVSVIDLGQGARGNVGQAGGLGHAVRHVDAKTIGSAVEPEAQNALELGGYLGVGPIEIRLLSREQMQVPLTVRDASPGRAAEYGRPVVGREVASWALPIAEDESRSLSTSGLGGQCFLNQGCWWEKWFGTRSIVTRIPRACAAATSASKSAIVPNIGSTSVGFATSYPPSAPGDV